MEWVLRPEEDKDASDIHALVAAAFKGVEHSDGSEPEIVDRLREGNDLTLSLVAEDASQVIVGHVAVSPVTISDGCAKWYGLGPVSVSPDVHKKGIGTALVRKAIELIQSDHRASGLVVLGEPQYYGRFGFEHDPKLMFPGPPAEFFQRIVFNDGAPPAGVVEYSKAFY